MCDGVRGVGGVRVRCREALPGKRGGGTPLKARKAAIASPTHSRAQKRTMEDSFGNNQGTYIGFYAPACKVPIRLT